MRKTRRRPPKPPPKRPTCATTGKVRYTAEIDALTVLARRLNHDAGEQRAYRCPHCHGWHLTSRR